MARAAGSSAPSSPHFPRCNSFSRRFGAAFRPSWPPAHFAISTAGAALSYVPFRRWVGFGKSYHRTFGDARLPHLRRHLRRQHHRRQAYIADITPPENRSSGWDSSAWRSDWDLFSVRQSAASPCISSAPPDPAGPPQHFARRIFSSRFSSLPKV